MPIDEVEAFKRAATIAQQRGWLWEPPFWLSLTNGEWEIQSEGERAIRLSELTGEIVAGPAALDPASALSIAKEYAARNELSWKPAFSLQVVTDHWCVGACQSQFGGQLSIRVNHAGEVIGSSVNRK